jgi:hypothetical protein
MSEEPITRTPKRIGEAERRVVDAFVAWLQSQGWRTWTEVNYLDVLAERNGQWLRAEAKSHTGDSAGLDVDTAFGQLLRRMDEVDDPDVRYAIVVPPASSGKAIRVPARIRELLRIDVYVADPDTGAVRVASEDGG